ncbi:MAG: YraN family protein [Candidatus Sungbacteria bacterium]|uniref:UPF0102 protein HY473_01995 n=1 Tax=Candidatus Sungiibacteriota bacterium TaxID=2750080 RepID=A0A933DRY9_9BACT|nr:YraN family protein [Candidatus Sungbacteria bacterium]
MAEKNSEIGRKGEESAINWLVKRDFKVLSTNYRKPYGEIDIVAQKGGIIHFVEVKTSKYRHETAFSPEIRVNSKKIRNLKRICETYIRERNVSHDQGWQIDVISVILDGTDAVMDMKLLENAIFEERY